MDRKQEREAFKPKQVKAADPVDGRYVPTDRIGEINTDPEEVEPATEAELAEELAIHGRLLEPEVAREADVNATAARGGFAGEAATMGNWYSETYWTHFDWRPDVKKVIGRVQQKLPYQTFANTYFMHPPVYGRTYEFVSTDFWAGGRSANGAFLGYRGKPIASGVGWNVVEALFADRYLPNIAWLIFGGKMWTRGYGWGPAPYGPAGSDAGHFFHVHCTHVL